MSKFYRVLMFCKKQMLGLATPRSVLPAVMLMCLAVNAYPQKENFVIDLKDVSLKEVMRSIKKQSGYSFLYQDDLIAGYGKRDFKIDTNGIEAVMNVLLTDTDLAYEVDDKVIVLKPEEKKSTAVADAIAFTITGVVKDNSGGLLPGVSVLVKGTTRGTVSNNDGAYTIEVEAADILVFSFIGYTTVEMPVRDRTTLDVMMQEDVSELGEVVVTGYQPIRKESFTGRAVTIGGEELKKVNPINVFQSIQAYDPSFRIMENNLVGSDPNRLPDINVRGATALPGEANQLNRTTLTSTNPNLPTFILDGFEVSMQTVYDLDINRIKSITVLKDAAATAIYGSRAANGVLVITTKEPQEGKLQFSYVYDMTITGPDLREYDVLNATEKLEYEYLAGTYDATRQRNAQTQDVYDQQYYAKKRQVLNGVDSYWLSEPVKTVVGHKHALTVEGGSQSLRYGITAYHQSLPGVMKDSERKRFGGSVYLSYNLNDKFLFRNTTFVAQINSQESPYGNFSDYVRMNPYYKKYDENGQVLRVLDEWKRRTNDEATDVELIATDAVLNPLYDASLSSFDKSKYTQIINAFSTQWNITNGLMMRGLISLTRYTGAQDVFVSPLANRYYNFSSADFNKRGDYKFLQTDENTIDGNLLLSYNTQIGHHTINASVGGNLKDFTSGVKGFQARGFTNDRFDNISFASRYYEDDSPYGFDQTDRLVGGFLTMNYSFADKYLLDLTGRMDGSSKFGSDKKYAPFWAAGIGWNLHNEGFLESVSSINQFRVTASTGLTGGVSFPPYLGKTTYAYYNDWYSTGVGATYMGYGNDNLKWQRTNNYDLGIDLIMFNNRLSVSPTYYYKLTHDLIVDIGTPPSMGFTSYKENLGELENRGYELGLKLDVIRNKDWNVSLTGNFVRNENKLRSISSSLKKYNDEADKLQDEEAYYAVPLLRYFEGQSLETIYAVPSRGIDPENGKELYVKKDGTLTYHYDVKDIVPVGSKTPGVYGYFGSSVSYRNFILFLSFYTKMGGDQYNQTLIDRVENADPRYNVDQRVLDARWKKPGDQTFYKDIADIGSTRATSRFVQSDDLVELKTVSLTYDAPAIFESKLNMQMLRFVVTMNDVWRWSSVKMERGIDYPFARSVTFSVQTRF